MDIVRWHQPDKENHDDEKQRAAQLITETGEIENRQSSWYEMNLWSATLYTNRELIGFRWGNTDATSELWPTNLRTENIIEEIGEAMLSKASSSPIRPALQPHGNSFKTERAVRLLDGFIWGVYRLTKSEIAAVEMFRDAFMAGLGCVRVDYDRRKKAVSVESVFFDNLVVDNRECANRAPPRTYRIRQVVPIASIEARYGVTISPQSKYVDYREVGDGYAVLVEAWRLPDSDGKGGYHMIAVHDQIIEEEKWKHDWVPLVFFHWQNRTSGFFCKSGVEQLIPYQVRQNELNDDIKSAQDIACRIRMLIHANSQIDLSQWDSDQGRFLMYSGMKPEELKIETRLQELYQERVTNKASAFSHMGVSETYANADLPQQIRADSSAGIREMRNMEDSRHLRLWTAFQEARLAIARMILLVLGEAGPGADEFTSVYHVHPDLPMKSLEWRAVKDLTKDKYSWTFEAVPASQTQPGPGRELLRDFVSRGLIREGSDAARQMATNPNLEWIEQCQTQALNDIRRHIMLMEEDDFEGPTEMTDTINGIPLVKANYHRLRNFEDIKESDEMVQNHIKWITMAAQIQLAATMPQAPNVPYAPMQAKAGTQAQPVYQPL